MNVKSWDGESLAATSRYPNPPMYASISGSSNTSALARISRRKACPRRFSSEEEITDAEASPKFGNWIFFWACAVAAASASEAPKAEAAAKCR